MRALAVAVLSALALSVTSPACAGAARVDGSEVAQLTDDFRSVVEVRADGLTGRIGDTASRRIAEIPLTTNAEADLAAAVTVVIEHGDALRTLPFGSYVRSEVDVELTDIRTPSDDRVVATGREVTTLYVGTALGGPDHMRFALDHELEFVRAGDGWQVDVDRPLLGPGGAPPPATYSDVAPPPG